MRWTRWAGVAMALTIGAGCTGSVKPDDAATEHTPRQVIELDPMLVQAGRDGQEAPPALDAEEVFQAAYRAFSARQYEDALVHYNTIIRYFPESRFMLPALFNAGLANEKLGNWSEAAGHYQTIIAQFATRKDAKDAYFRLAEVNATRGEHEPIVALMTEVMLRPDVNHFDRVEAHVRRASALTETGALREAEDGFRAAIKLNDDARPEAKLNDDAYYISQANFGMGRAVHLQVLKIPLVLPTERMGEDLNAKAELFLKAQSAYLRALRVHHPQWSVAAGFMIGRLYEDFYLDIFAAEIPDDLGEEGLTMYFEELRSQLRPLMERAIQVYKKNLSLSQRILESPAQSDWAAQSELHLTRLEAYLKDPFTQRRAERLVLQRRPLKELWDPDLMARDVVSDALERARRGAKRAPNKT